MIGIPDDPDVYIYIYICICMCIRVHTCAYMYTCSIGLALASPCLESCISDTPCHIGIRIGYSIWPKLCGSLSP